MSYGIVRVQKMTKGSVKGIEIHDLREKEGVSHTNKDIDWDRTNLNFDLAPNQEKNFNKAVKERIQELNLTKAVRKDAIVMAQVLVTSDKSFFDGLSAEQTKEFFQKSYEFFKERYGEKNIVSSIVHMDERTPHMHFNFVPVTSDGRLSAKSILNRVDLIKQHDDFFKEIGKSYGLLRGEKNSENTHLETADFKKQTANNEIKVLEQQKEKLERQVDNLKYNALNYQNLIGCVHDLEQIEVKKSLTGSKVTLSKEDFDNLYSNAINGFKAKNSLEQENKSLISNFGHIKKSYESMKLKQEPLEKENFNLKKDLRDTKQIVRKVIEAFDENPQLKQDYHTTRKIIANKNQIEQQKSYKNNHDYEMDR